MKPLIIWHKTHKLWVCYTYDIAYAGWGANPYRACCNYYNNKKYYGWPG